MRTYEFDVPNGMSTCEIKDFAGAASNEQLVHRMIRRGCKLTHRGVFRSVRIHALCPSQAVKKADIRREATLSCGNRLCIKDRCLFAA
jgi:hypothetical protein